MMRILHTSDWHLGAQLYGYDRTEDQRAAIRDIIAVASGRDVDAVVVSGDVFDVSAPSSMSQRMLSELLAEMRQRCPRARIILTAGNHDGGSRLQAFSDVFDIAGINVVGLAGRTDLPSTFVRRLVVEIPGKGYIIALPYINSRNINDAFRSALSRAVAGLDPALPVVLMAHQAVEGCVFRGHSSVGEAVGGVAMIRSDCFGGVADYVALGHIHKPQTLSGGHARYSGSPLQISFDEDYAHSVTVVDIACRGADPVIDEVVLEVRRPLVTLGGEKGMSVDEALCRAHLEADPATATLSPGSFVRMNFSLAAGQMLEPSLEAEIRNCISEAGCTFVMSAFSVCRPLEEDDGAHNLTVAEFKKLRPLDVALDYCRRTGRGLTDDQIALFNEITAGVEAGSDNDDDETA